MSAPKTVVILGGGVGGLVAARELRKRLPREHRVVLVDREREHLFAPSLLWLMVGLTVTPRASSARSSASSARASRCVSARSRRSIPRRAR
jgi:NADH dehydrogenase FAD-containing subunit